MLALGVSSQRRMMLSYFALLLFCIVCYAVLCMDLFNTQTTKKRLKETKKLAGHEQLNLHQDVKKGKTNEDKKPLKGGVNMHVFEDCCGGSLEQLRSNRLYPLFPNVRTTVQRLAVSPRWSSYGLRLFGFLHPSLTGEYIFAVASDDNSEFWLSINDSPKNLQRLSYVGETGSEWTAPGEFWKFSSQISKPVLLVAGMKYYFEALLKQSEGMDHLEVAWSSNQDNSTFTIINSEYLSLYEDESSMQMGDIEHIPQTEASYDRLFETNAKSKLPVKDMVREDSRDNIYRMTMMDESYLSGAFAECLERPSPAPPGKMERFSAIKLINFSSVYPNDYTRQTNPHEDQMCFYEQDPLYQQSEGLASYLKKVEDSNTQSIGPVWQRVYDVEPLNFASKQVASVMKSCRTTGNIIMSRSEAMRIVRVFLTALHSNDNTRGFSLLHVLNVVRSPDKGVSSRYLVELELVGPQGQKLVVSHYVFASATQLANNVLCSQRGFTWNPVAMVHIIVAVKNQARWIIQFIREMEKVYRATGDKNFNVIIVDFNSTDINIEARLKKAKLPSYRFKQIGGRFQRTGGLQAGIDLVDDERSILFLCDLHLYFPVNILNSIRKHCVEGRMVYAPVVMRLDCDASPRVPTGYWEIAGYGLIGIYTSDMRQIGGMNVKEFKDKWGGEDWELLDRIVGNGLEVERLHLRNFLHHFHSRRGMWENSPDK